MKDFSSEIMQMRKQYIFQELEKTVNPEFYTWQKCLSKMKVKYCFSDIQKLEEFIIRFAPQKNIFKISFRKKEITPNGSLDLHKEMKSTRNSNYRGKYVRLFII